MSEISKGALTSENNNSFPNNNTGYITPTILRTFNQNMIDSLVDEISYTADSASFNQRINNLDPSGSAQSITALNAFTQSQNAFNASATASIVALQNFSSSLDATFATDAQLTALSTSIAVTDLAQSQSIAQLLGFSSSLDATYATDAQLTALSTSVAVTDSGQDNKINSLINATGSFITSAQTASMSVLSSSYALTASFALNGGGGGTIDTSSLVTTSSFNAYTQSNDAKVNALISATGSYITSAQTSSMTVLSASFATSASQAVSASYALTASFALNTLSSSFAISSSLAQNLVIIARNGNPSTLGAGTIVHITSAVGDNPIFDTASYDSEALSANTLGMLRTTAASGADVDVLVSGIVTGVNTDPALGYAAGDIIYLGPTGSFTKVQPQAPNQIVTIGQVLRAQQNNGSIYVNISNGWELEELHNVAINSVADGDLLVYRSASGLWTNSSSLELGNATTGSNTFVGNQIVSSSIIGVGDLYIQPTNQTTDFSNISASVSGNIIFGAIFGDSQPQQTGSLVISGSNNLVLMGKPTATSGYYSYLNGAQNIYGLRTLLSTGSVLRPFMYNNILQRTVTLNFITSSNATQPGFSNNLLYGNGTTTFNHQSGSLSFQGNLVGGNNILTSTQNVTPTTTRVAITSNIINGTQTFLHQSSSITLDRNIFNGLTAPGIRNDFSNSFNDGLTVSRNIVNGSSVLIYNSGSTTAGSAVGNRSITDNLFGGVNIIVSSSHIAANNGNANLVGAIVHGYNLNVSASSTTSTGGNVFVGRNNDTSSNLASTSDIIFAVGTGTSTSARKTGLWIDTGSLTTINGGLYVTQSQVTLTNSGSTPDTLALAVRSGSVEVTSPQGNGYFYTNLPITSSNLRINGDGIISDLFVSGVFAGNGTLNVAGNSYLTGALNVNNNVNITGSLDVNGTNIINTLNGLSSQTSSYVTESETSSFATTGSNNFVGDQKITGSVRVDGDFFLDDDGGTTSFLMNSKFNTEFLGSQWRWFESAKKFAWDVFEEVVDINLAAYGTGYDNGLSINLRSDGTTFSDYNTSYVTQSWLRIPVNSNNNPAPQFPRGAGISGSLLVSGSTIVTGSVVGNVNSLSISSNTASLNLNNGNFFTLQLVSGSVTHINPTNIKAGQTINIRLNTTGSATVTFPSSVKQVSGSLYIPTPTTGVDILTLVTFDTSDVYLANVKNLI